MRGWRWQFLELAGVQKVQVSGRSLKNTRVYAHRCRPVTAPWGSGCRPSFLSLFFWNKKRLSYEFNSMGQAS